MGRDGTDTGAAQRVATAMPVPLSPRWLVSTGHVGLAKVVWHVDHRSLTSPKHLVWLGSSRAERCSHLQVLTENLGSFWSLDEIDLESREMSGVFYVE